MNTLGRVILVGVFPPGVEAQLTLRNRWGAERIETILIPPATGSASVRAGSSNLNFSTESLTIEFSLAQKSIDGQFVNLHSVQLERPYSYNMFIGHSNIRMRFSSEEYSDNQSHFLQIGKAGGTAALVLKEPFESEWSFLYLVLAVFFGFASFLIVGSTDWSNLPAIRDMSLGNKISTHHEFDTVNGLRGLAALLVLFSHTAPGFFAIQLGLSLLFIFSGFLLSKPFVMDANKINSWSVLRRFLIKRLKRILPVYYLYIFIIYVITFQFDVAIRHFLFVQAEGHLWPMTQIFTFYMLLPIVIFITSLTYRLHRLLPVLLLMLAIYAWLGHGTSWKPYFNGVYSHEFYLHAFLMGVLGAYLQYDIIQNWRALKSLFERYRSLIALLAGVVFVLTIAWSAPISPPHYIKPFISQFYVKCMLSLLIILLALNLQKTWFNRLLNNWLFRSVGIVGFSFYILHGLGMQIVLEFQTAILGVVDPVQRSWSFMAASFVVTYAMAMISYCWVERPFFGYRDKP